MGKTKSSSKHLRAHAQQQNGDGHVLPSKLARYLDPEASWDKDQLLDAVHWIQQVLGLVCGLLWGAVPLVGAVWIAPFLAISTGIIYWYYAYLLKIDRGRIWWPSDASTSQTNATFMDSFRDDLTSAIAHSG